MDQIRAKNSNEDKIKQQNDINERIKNQNKLKKEIQIMAKSHEKYEHFPFISGDQIMKHRAQMSA